MSNNDVLEFYIGKENLIQEIEHVIQYTFHSKEVLFEALTHSSYKYEFNTPLIHDNERLEFLGDAVLEFLTSEFLFQQFPKYSEGQLSKMRSLTVNSEMLSQLARELRLGEFIFLGKGEELTGGREKSSILADCFEALIAALYIDGGFDASRQFFQFLMVPKIREIHSDDFQDVDYKTRVQEWVQKHLQVTPHYDLVHTEGPDHNKIFTIEILVNGASFGTGKGKSKKEASQNAAKNNFDKIKLHLLKQNTQQ
mgnify:CR=1 FL=1